MHPFYESSFQVKGHIIIHEKPKSPTTYMKKAFNFVRSHTSFYRYAFILSTILLLEISIVRFFTTNARSPDPLPKQPFSSIHLQEQQQQPEQAIHQLPLPRPPQSHDDQEPYCKYGKVYVYDLPPMFNKQLLENCNDLDPWKSKCAAVSNNGFGPGAGATLLADRVIPQELTDAWYWTDHCLGEIIFHTRMSNYQCRTVDPESAVAFYVPFYAGLAVTKYLFNNYTAKQRDSPCERLLGWIQDQPYWKRSNGSDHFLMLGRVSWDFRRTRDEDWGISFLLMPSMNMYRLTVERRVDDPLDVSVPYPSGFHPKSTSQLKKWQEFVRARNRSNLFTFVGGKRDYIKNDFRSLLLDQCYNESDSCRAVDCAKTPCLEGSSVILEAFLDSNFCLQPKGDSMTRRSTFDCMLAGSIPVFFWEGTIGGQYELFMSNEPESFSVFIHRNKVRNGTSIRKVLEGYSEEDTKRMRDNVIDMIPRISYAFPPEGLANGVTRDAFDVGVEEVLRRIVNKPSIRDNIE